MREDIVKDKQDLTYLKWSHIRSSSGTAGTFLKSESNIGGKKTYYKLSNYDPVRGIVGHECINEIIVARLLTLLDVEHLSYKLINADIEIEGKLFSTYLCASEDYKEPKESKAALDNFYRVNSIKGESHYEFCVRMGWRHYIDQMIALDYIILNRDRHGANIEVLRNQNTHSIRIAPLFDHGISLLYSCLSDKEVLSFDILEDKRCNNFIGSFSCYDNLKLISGKKLFSGNLEKNNKEFLFNGLEDILSEIFIEKIWKMIWERYKIYENL